jgi:hypothetical protein
MGFFTHYHNPNLRLVTKARACKGAGQKWAHESHFMVSGMQESVREWTPTLGVGVSMDFQIFIGQLQGSKLIGLKNPLYNWKTLGK